MSTLYPLKFTPILKEKIWGGQKLNTLLKKNLGTLPNAGESWEISGVGGDESVVSNGFLKGNTLNEILEIYMGELVGDKVFQQFGNEFPLLIKFIDANDVLSIQVHPDDKLSKERHQAFGKTEMWYVMQADKDASLISGFNQQVNKEQYIEALKNDTLEALLANHKVQTGDVFFIPAGRVHAIGQGIMLAEIQQTSDVTYRIYDFNRKDKDGKTRDLHTDLAIDAIDFSYSKEARTNYSLQNNQPTEVVNCDYFKTNIIEFDKTLERDFYGYDSFLIYLCVEGEFDIQYSDQKEVVTTGETILIPADLQTISLIPKSNCKVIEVHL